MKRIETGKINILFDFDLQSNMAARFDNFIKKENFDTAIILI